MEINVTFAGSNTIQNRNLCIFSELGNFHQLARKTRNPTYIILLDQCRDHSYLPFLNESKVEVGLYIQLSWPFRNTDDVHRWQGFAKAR